uniref:Reverse transcriptase domain-containing protein n=1 Tax=Romanomermis culicivorax TaxID=13658 RepID=A0A915IWT2_ROMCU
IEQYDTTLNNFCKKVKDTLQVLKQSNKNPLQQMLKGFLGGTRAVPSLANVGVGTSGTMTTSSTMANGATIKVTMITPSITSSTTAYMIITTASSSTCDPNCSSWVKLWVRQYPSLVVPIRPLVVIILHLEVVGNGHLDWDSPDLPVVNLRQLLAGTP